MATYTRYQFVGADHVRAMDVRSRRRWHVTGDQNLTAAALDLGSASTGFAATYVVSPDLELWVASLRSEHFACANGGEVLAAGEMTFTRERGRWTVSDVNNRSTGYCPEPNCWQAVESVLDRAGLPHTGGFTPAFEFRLCPRCGNTNLIKDQHFGCACGADLPVQWNFPRSAAAAEASIQFSKIRGPLGFLSNFSKHPVEIDGRIWPTTEHYYQAQKFSSEALQEEIRALPSAYDAAHFARARPEQVRADWPAVKLAVMEKALWAKITQHPTLQPALLATGDSHLVEKSARDSFWGSGSDGRGLNHLGYLWMQIRHRLHCGPS